MNYSKKNPLVTLAIFSFNHEKYIEECVASALRSSYDNLEIIVSDDCSTDTTFQKIEKLIEEYEGHHEVIIRQNSTNLGLIDHLFTVARMAKGELLVVTGGDDRVLSNRVTKLKEAWLETDAAALSSNHHEIDQNGDIIKKNASFKGSLPGFSAAYKTEILANLPFCHKSMYAEDGLIGALLKVRGEKIYKLPDALVEYRIHEFSQTIRGTRFSKAAVLANEEKIRVSALDLANRIKYLLQNGYSADMEIDGKFLTRISHDWICAEIQSTIWEKSFSQKAAMLQFGGDWRISRFILPRLLGIRFFVFLKMSAILLSRWRK